jgi:hypothetical protein
MISQLTIVESGFRSVIRSFAMIAALIGLCFGDSHAAENAQCKGVYGFSESSGLRTFLWHPDGLQASRHTFEKAGRDANPAIAELLKAADRALRLEPVSVTEKTRVANGATARHYTSLAPYWWPDSKNPLRPYVRRDGKTNPERDGKQYDLLRLQEMSQSVEALSLAAYLTREKKYAEAAATWIRVWFLDLKRSMLPNFDFAQAVPGRASGRKEGVIDGRWLMPVAESIALLEPFDVLSNDEQKALRDWYAELVKWMVQSELGKAERAAKNNHGIFYDLELIHFALFAGMEDVAKHITQKFPETRLKAQMAEDGSLPEELKRTRSFHYSTWTVGAIFDVATLSSCLLPSAHWQLDAAAPSPKRALQFIEIYLDANKKWPWPEEKLKRDELHHSLFRASFYLRDAALSHDLAGSDTDPSARYRIWLQR